MTRIVGVNGINTHGQANVDLVLHELARRGFETVDVQLPRRHWFSARWGARDDGYLVAEASADGDVVVAHSFGALRAWYADRVRSYKAIICIAPAMSKRTEWTNPRRVHCYHSGGDWIVKLGSRLPFHPFGRAGIEGFDQLVPFGTNHRVKSDHDDYFDRQLGLFLRISNHVELLARQQPHGRMH